MSRVTQLKLLRKHQPEALVHGSNPIPTQAYPCPVCGEAMYLSEGQIQATHKKCRKEARENDRKLKQKYNL